MRGPSLQPETASRLDVVLSWFRHAGQRVVVLIVLTYVSGVGGILMTLVGNPADPRSVYGVTGVVLMGISFFCMFGLSITMLNLTGDAR